MLHRRVSRARWVRFRSVAVFIVLGALFAANSYAVSRADAAKRGFLIANSPFGTPIADGITGIATTQTSRDEHEFLLVPSRSLQAAFGEQSGGTGLRSPA